MLRVLLVDDEYLVTDFLKMMIDKETVDVEVVGVARSGREAIEQALNTSPDVVFMDIRMPGINGIEAIKEIRRQRPRIEFVIITAYEYFDYAKEAVKLNVAEYLLKPLIKDRVLQVLSDLADKLSKKDEQLRREMMLKEKIERIMPHIETQFIHSMLLGDIGNQDFDFYESIFQMNFKRGVVLVGHIPDNFQGDFEEDLDAKVTRQQFFDFFTMMVKRHYPSLVGGLMHNRIIAYIPVEENVAEYEIRNVMLESARKIAKSLRNNVAINFRLGVSRSCTLTTFQEAYREAVYAAKNATMRSTQHIEDLAVIDQKVQGYTIALENDLVHHMSVGDFEKAKKTFNRIYYSILAYSDELNVVKSFLLMLWQNLRKHLPLARLEHGVNEADIMRRIMEATDQWNLELIYVNQLKAWITELHEIRNDEHKSQMMDAMAFLQDHYQEAITLNDVAERANMSYHYFSKTFKKFFDESFVDCLTRLRIEEAKRLLATTSMSVKGIALDVGYADPNYFSKIFKKYEAMSPSEYRSNMEVKHG